jgi:hypothetical protein
MVEPLPATGGGDDLLERADRAVEDARQTRALIAVSIAAARAALRALEQDVTTFIPEIPRPWLKGAQGHKRPA